MDLVQAQEPQRSSSQPSSRRSGSRETILAAARRVLAEVGYADFGLERVAEESGFSRRTIYNQFASRERLYRASREQLVLEIATLVDRRISTAEPTRRALSRFTKRLLAAFGDSRHLEILTSIVADRRREWLGDLYHRHVRQPVTAAVELFLHEKIRAGEFMPADVCLAAFQFISSAEAMVVGPRLFGAPQVEGIDPEVGCEALVEAFLMQHAPLGAFLKDRDRAA